MTSNYLSIKGSQLKNYDNENKDDHEKELFNTVLNNIQVYTSPNVINSIFLYIKKNIYW